MDEAIDATDEPTRRRTTMVPIMTMEEVAIPSVAEQEAMRRSLAAEEALIAAGHGRVHSPSTFVQSMMSIRDAEIQSRTDDVQT